MKKHYTPVISLNNDRHHGTCNAVHLRHQYCFGVLACSWSEVVSHRTYTALRSCHVIFPTERLCISISRRALKVHLSIGDYYDVSSDDTLVS